MPPIDVSNSPKDQELLIWDLHRHQQIAAFNYATPVSRLAYSPEGTRLVAGFIDGTLRLFNASDLTEIPLPKQHSQAVVTRQMVFLANGWLATGSYGGDITFWDPEIGRDLATLHGPGRVLLLDRSEDGLQLAAFFLIGRDVKMKWWDVETQREVASFTKLRSDFVSPPNIESLELSPDRRRLAFTWNSSTNVGICDARTGESQLELSGLKGYPHAVKFSPDNQLIVAGTDLGEIGIWDSNSGDHLATLKGHVGAVSIFKFSRDGTRLYSGDMQGSVRVWDLTAPPEVEKVAPVRAISPNRELGCVIENRNRSHPAISDGPNNIGERLPGKFHRPITSEGIKHH